MYLVTGEGGGGWVGGDGGGWEVEGGEGREGGTLKTYQGFFQGAGRGAFILAEFCPPLDFILL